MMIVKLKVDESGKERIYSPAFSMNKHLLKKQNFPGGPMQMTEAVQGKARFLVA